MTIRISDHLRSSSTRDRARKFYPMLRKLVSQADAGEIIISFEGMEFVSPSFLDETVVALFASNPTLAERVHVVGLQPFAADRLQDALRRHGVRDSHVEVAAIA